MNIAEKMFPRRAESTEPDISLTLSTQFPKEDEYDDEVDGRDGYV